MSAAVLDCCHLLLIVAMGIAHGMLASQCKARPTMLCIRLVPSFADVRGMEEGEGGLTQLFLHIRYM